MIQARVLPSQRSSPLSKTCASVSFESAAVAISSRLRRSSWPCQRSSYRTSVMAMALDARFPATATVVSVNYSDIEDKDADISKELEAGFGPDGLGIIAISGVPGYVALRQRLLYLAESLAALPQAIKKSLEDPDSRYSFGWSHGKEILESGQPDVLKGSFYANPIHDKPTSNTQLMQRYPSYCRPNLWPHHDLPELEPAFKELGKLMIDVGLLLAHHCDNYVASKNSTGQSEKLQHLLQKSQCHKGRLLHYFPPSLSAEAENKFNASSWCGWHTDHGSLTGLTAAMYMKNGEEVACPDNRAGLYVKTLFGEVLKVSFQADQIGYQLGESTELLSNHVLHATPHCVQMAGGAAAAGVVRNTFALFMQPHWDQPVKVVAKSGKESRNLEAVTFGDFTEETLSKYYQD